jgi:hypothetical protein
VFSLSKIHVVGDTILYDGDQIAFLIDPNGKDVELSISREDLVNGEVPFAKRQEILNNKYLIIQEIKRLGYTIV